MTSERHQGKTSLVDYASWNELDALIASQNSLYTINGLPNSKDKVTEGRSWNHLHTGDDHNTGRGGALYTNLSLTSRLE